jgi:hypothetical protein
MTDPKAPLGKLDPVSERRSEEGRAGARRLGASGGEGRRSVATARHGWPHRAAVRLLPSRAAGREPTMDPPRTSRSGGPWLAGG